MKIKAILMSSVCLGFSTVAWGQTSEQCTIPPTCGELGYEQQESDCTGQYMLHCPFDTSKVFCGGVSCSYTATSKPSGCSVAASCFRDGLTYYSTTCNSCYVGYSKTSSGTCSQTCNYYMTSHTACVTYTSCQRGSASGVQTYYECTGGTCADGYYMNFFNHCESCSYMYRNGRQSGPYTQEQCESFDACKCGTSPITYTCGNQTWYACKERCNCAV